MLHLAADSTQLLQEDLFGMFSALSLHISHYFASLTKVELRPVANIHLQDVPLRKLYFSLSQKVQILVIEKWSHHALAILCRLGDSFTGCSQLSLLFLLFLLEHCKLLSFCQRQVLHSLLSHDFSLSEKLIELSLFDLFDVLVFKVHPVQASKPFALVDYGKEAFHRQLNLFDVIVAEINLAKLLAHQEVRLEFVLLFE